MAISYSVSYSFSPSTVISSSQVNQNFNDNSNTWNGLEAKTKTFSNLGIDTQLKSGGTIESADGAVGAPGITFSGDLDNGLYRVGANNPAIAAGGTKVIDMKTTGVSVLGTTTNDSAAAGFVGEYISSIVSSAANAASSGTFKDVTSISLTAGDWDVSGLVVGQLNAATTTAEYGAVSLFTGNTTTDHVFGDNVTMAPPPAAAYFSGMVIPVWRISLTATTTVYLKVKFDFSAGTPQYVGRISARRVR